MPTVKHKFLRKLAHIVIHRPKFIVITSIALAFISLFFAAKFLQFDTDQDNLISKKLAYHQRYKSFLSQFGDWEYLFVVFVVPKGQEEKTKRALESLVDKIKNRKELYTEIAYREDVSVFKNRGLLLLPEREFESLNKKLSQWHPKISQISTFNNYAALFNFIAGELKAKPAELKKNQKELEQSFSLLKRILDGINHPEKIASLSSDDLFQLILGKKIYQDPDGFFFSQNGRLLFLKIMPQKDYETTGVVDKPLQFLRDQVQKTRQEFPDLSFGITGRPALQADEMSSATSDSKWAALAALIGVTLLFMFYFRNLKRPLLSIASLICGIAWSVGFVTLTIGHLNLLSIVFAVILIGLGIDYGIHFIFRYQSIRHKGLPIEKAIEKTIITSGSAIITGAVSSSAAFLSALFTDFLGLQELGFIAGTGILFCLVSQIVTLPAFLLLWDQKIKSKKALIPPQFKGLDWALTKPKDIFVFLCIITFLSVPSTLSMDFENNLLELQDPNLESVHYEHKIIDESEYSTWFAAFLTPSKEKLKELERKLISKKSVGYFESIYSVVPSNQSERIESLGLLKQKLNLQTPEVNQPVNLEKLSLSLEAFKKALEPIQDLAFEAGELEAVEEIDKMMSRIKSIQNKIELNPETSLLAIQKSQDHFFNFLKSSFSSFTDNLSPSKLQERDLPSSVQKRYVSDRKNYVLYAYPDKDIWQQENMEAFIVDLRKIDPQVTGSPISVYESALRMKKGFFKVGLLALLFVMVILWLDFRSVQYSLIAALPLIAGILWLIAGMNILNISLNLGNFFALPILIGIGIDNGVHLMHRYRETKNVKDVLHVVSPAITLSSLTTLLGFGALSFVSHRGLASFGKIMSIGSLTCLIAAVLLIPVILKIFYDKENS